MIVKIEQYLNGTTTILKIKFLDNFKNLFTILYIQYSKTPTRNILTPPFFQTISTPVFNSLNNVFEDKIETEMFYCIIFCYKEIKVSMSHSHFT